MRAYKIRWASLKNFGANNMQNLARFYTTSDFDRDSRISSEPDKISKIGKICDRERFLPRSAKGVR